MVLIFLGAGFSKAMAGIPPMKELNKGFEKFLKEKNEFELERDYKTIKKQIEEAYEEFGLNKPDIEAILTLLENLKSEDPLCNIRNPTVLYILSMSYHDLVEAARGSTTKENFSKIIQNLKFYILKKCLEAKVKDYEQLSRLVYIHTLFKEKNPIDRQGIPLLYQPKYTPNIEIFTTNYDLVLEDFCRKSDYEFTNGQTKDKVDLSKNNKDFERQKQNIKIFKLHGSANWCTIKGEEDIFFHNLTKPIDVTRMGEKDEDFVIYPVAEKVWMRFPFSYLYLRFQESLIRSEEWVFVGFSFRDKEIVEMMINASKIRHKEGNSLDLYIINPQADEIKKRLGSLRGTIHPINKGIEKVEKEDFREVYMENVLTPPP